MGNQWIWINIDGLGMDMLEHVWKGLKQHGRECKGTYEFPTKCGNQRNQQIVNFRKRMQERFFLGEYITPCLELSAPEFNAFLIHVEQHIRALKPFYNTESFFKE